MTTEHFIAEALQLPVTAIDYQVSRRLRTLYPDKALLEGGDQFFNMEEYARAGQCTLTQKAVPISQRLTYWRGAGSHLLHRAHQTWFAVAWQGEQLDVLIMHFGDGMSSPYHYYLLADHAEVAERFLCAVCEWNMELRDEVLVFEGGGWHKDADLFVAIKGATLENLVLRGSLKEEIRADLATFFAARETYATYGVPWKRGILFVGPAGNGKTHAVKALVNALGQPCLYVKSFHTPMPDEYSIRAVFERARASAPCILVLEDLDSLVTPTNRSFFLNELDGFAGNVGILTLATTNHPERLDPAIIDRPSRFDRKYPFDLPAVEERRVYIAQWNASLQPALRLSEAAAAQIAEQTEGFSFAYLKELFLSAMMRWIATAQPGTMEQVMGEQVGVLREQMASTALLPAIEPGSEAEGGVFPPQRHWMRPGPPRQGWQAHVFMHPPHGGDDVPL